MKRDAWQALKRTLDRFAEERGNAILGALADALFRIWWPPLFRIPVFETLVLREFPRMDCPVEG